MYTFLINYYLKMYTCKYKIKGKPIGEGGFGIVSLVERDGYKYVLKKIINEKGEYEEEYIESFFLNPIELDIMFRLNSPHLVQGVEITVQGECDPDSVGLVTEYIEGNALKDMNKFDYEDVKRMMYDLALGLKCLHDNKYLHLDIKLDNVLYHKEIKPRAVLIDYGNVTYCLDGVKKGKDCIGTKGTFYYFSPKTAKYEAVKGKDDDDELVHYSDKDDIWSLGLTFCEMLSDLNTIFNWLGKNTSGDNPKDFKKLYDYFIYYMGKRNIDEFLEIVIFDNWNIDDKEKSLFKSLIKKMLEINEDNRYDIKQIVDHPYFASYTKNNSCSVSKPQRYSLENVSVKQLNKVDYIIRKCKEVIPDRTAEIFFMAVDIYLRFISRAPKEVLEKVEKPAKVCLLIANKYFSWDILEEKFDSKIFSYIEEENLVYKVIGGRIKEERYFSNCQTLEQAKAVYDNLIKPSPEGHNPNLINFLLYDGKDYVNNLNVEGQVSVTQTRIEDLF